MGGLGGPPRPPMFSVLDGRFPREALLLRPRGGHERETAGKERGAGHGRDPRRVEVGDAAPLEKHGHDPARHVERLREPRRAVGQAQHLLDPGAAVRKQLAHRERVRHLEALRALEHRREHERHAPEVGLRRREVEHGGDGDLEPAARDAHTVALLRPRPAVHRHVLGLGEALPHALDVRVAEHLLVPAERLGGERMDELRPLAEDRELLADLRAARRAEVEVDRFALHGDDHPLDRLERPGEVVGHEHERGAGAVGEPRVRRAGDGQDEDERDCGPRGPRAQNVTDGWWTPKTPRSRSQISPSVTAASTASTMRGRRLSRPRAAVSSASSARRAASRSRAARYRVTFSARAPPTAGSTWKRFAGGASAVTYSLTPTTIRAWSSTSRW